MKSATSSGTSALRLVSAWISPSETTSTIFASIVLPIPCSSFARPSSASCATDADVSRIRAAAFRYAPIRNESPPWTSIRSASRSSCACELVVSGKPNRHVSDHRRARCARPSACPPTTSARTSSRCSARSAALLRDGDRVLVIDDASPDGTGELADRLAAELGFVDVLHRPHKEGLGPAYLAGFARALADGRRADPRDGLRLLARPGRRPPPDRRRRGRRRPRARLALRPRRPRRELGRWCAAGSRAAPRSTPRSSCRWACATRPAASSASAARVLETIPLDRVHAAGLRVPDRDDLPRQPAGFRIVEVPITFADRTAGHSKMSRTIVLEAIWRVPLLRFRR